MFHVLVAAIGSAYLGVSLLTFRQHVIYLCRGTNSGVLPKRKERCCPRGLWLWNHRSFPSAQDNPKLKGRGLATKVKCIFLGTQFFLQGISFLILASMENCTYDVTSSAPLRLPFTLLQGISAWIKVDLICFSAYMLQHPIYLLVFVHSWRLFHLEKNFSRGKVHKYEHI